MTTVSIVAAALVVFVSMAYVIARLMGQRDEARHEADRLERELEARLTDPSTATTQRVPWLRVVRETDDVPVADESWLDEITKPGGWS